MEIGDIPESLAIQMLKRDSHYRKTEAFQRLYDTMEYFKGGYNEVVEDTVQMLVLEEFGFAPTTKNLEKYRSIPGLFPDSEEVRDSAFFLKYNIMEDEPAVEVGDTVCNVSLVSLSEKKTDLFSEMKPELPTVILAGSIS